MSRVRVPAFGIDVFYSHGRVLRLAQLPVSQLKPYGSMSRK